MAERRGHIMETLEYADNTFGDHSNDIQSLDSFPMEFGEFGEFDMFDPPEMQSMYTTELLTSSEPYQPGGIDANFDDEIMGEMSEHRPSLTFTNADQQPKPPPSIDVSSDVLHIGSATTGPGEVPSRLSHTSHSSSDFGQNGS
jgi:hypothetical protein